MLVRHRLLGLLCFAFSSVSAAAPIVIGPGLEDSGGSISGIGDRPGATQAAVFVQTFVAPELQTTLEEYTFRLIDFAGRSSSVPQTTTLESFVFAYEPIRIGGADYIDGKGTLFTSGAVTLASQFESQTVTFHTGGLDLIGGRTYGIGFSIQDYLDGTPNSVGFVSAAQPYADGQIGNQTLGYGSQAAGNAVYRVIFDPKDLAFSATFRSPDSPLLPLTGTVSEPTSLALAGIGLAGLGLSRRRGRRHDQKAR